MQHAARALAEQQRKQQIDEEEAKRRQLEMERQAYERTREDIRQRNFEDTKGFSYMCTLRLASLYILIVVTIITMFGNIRFVLNKCYVNNSFGKS